MQVIIPLAGAGVRMRPHTHTKPKPLIEFAGKPGLSHVLDDVKDIKGVKISEVIFITGYMGDKIEEFVKKNYDFKSRFVQQKTLDGSAGAVLLTEKFIHEDVLIIFPDAVFDIDYSIISKLKKDEGGVIWGKEVEDYQRFGVLVTGKDGYLTKMVEKPSEPISKLANIGVYYIKDYKLMFEGIKYLFANKKNIKGEYYLPDAFAYMIEHGAKILCPPVKGWYDFGKPETLLESNKELLKKPGRHREVKAENSKIIPPVHIYDDVKIIDSAIGPFVTVGKGSEIIKSTVKDSVIGKCTKITNADIKDSIIGDECQVSGAFEHLNIGDHSVVHGSEQKKKG
ncbi:nucleotidyltransferase [Candidatus Woesearchaeota archaeon]|nr:nucleotidyltransferase [Candidatus Woesearchaeota archaeon]